MTNPNTSGDVPENNIPEQFKPQLPLTPEQMIALVDITNGVLREPVLLHLYNSNIELNHYFIDTFVQNTEGRGNHPTTDEERQVYEDAIDKSKRAELPFLVKASWSRPRNEEFRDRNSPNDFNRCLSYVITKIDPTTFEEIEFGECEELGLVFYDDDEKPVYYDASEDGYNCNVIDKYGADIAKKLEELYQKQVDAGLSAPLDELYKPGVFEYWKID